MHQELTDSLVTSSKIEIMEWVQRTPLFGVHVTEKNVGVLGLTDCKPIISRRRRKSN